MTARELFFAFAGALLALLLTLVNKDKPEPYDPEIIAALAAAIPAAVFCGFVADRPEEKFKAPAGFAAVIASSAAITAFAFLFAGRSHLACAVFLIATALGIAGFVWTAKAK